MEVIQLFGCFLLTVLVRSNETDWYRSSETIVRNDRPKRSSELDHHQIISSTSTSTSSDGDGSRIKEEEELPWLVERKKLRFILKKWKLWQYEDVKNKVRKNHMWYKIAYNCTQLWSLIINWTLTVSLRAGLFCWHSLWKHLLLKENR